MSRPLRPRERKPDGYYREHSGKDDTLENAPMTAMEFEAVEKRKIGIFNDYVPMNASNQAAPHFIEHPPPTCQASASDSETIYLVDGIDKEKHDTPFDIKSESHETGRGYTEKMVLTSKTARALNKKMINRKTLTRSGFDSVEFEQDEVLDLIFASKSESGDFRALFKAARDAANGSIHPDIQVRRILNEDDPVYKAQFLDGGVVLGVFANKKIEQGTVLGAYLGEIVEQEEDEEEEEEGEGEQQGDKKKIRTIRTRESMPYDFTLSQPKDKDMPQLIVKGSKWGNEMSYINDHRNVEPCPNVAYLHVTINEWPFVIIATIIDIDKGQQVLADYGDDYWQNHPINGNRCETPDVVCLSQFTEETNRKGKRAKEMGVSNAYQTQSDKRVQPKKGSVGRDQEFSEDVLDCLMQMPHLMPPAEQTQDSASPSHSSRRPWSRSLFTPTSFTPTSPNPCHTDIFTSPASTVTPASKRFKGASPQTKLRPGVRGEKSAQALAEETQSASDSDGDSDFLLARAVNATSSCGGLG